MPEPDIKILRSGELMVAGVQAQNGDATEFIDAYFPKREGAEFTVVDSGRLVLSEKDLDEFVASAKFDGFKVEISDGI